MTTERYKHETKEMPCRVCGTSMTVGIRTKNPPRCFDCGIKAAVAATRQMALKSGPYYDRWVQGMINAHGRPPRTTPSKWPQ